MHEKAFSHYMGKAAEYLAMSALTARGYKVFMPSVDVGNSDLLAELNGEIKRIQVKCVSTISHPKTGKPYRFVELRKSGRNDKGKSREYTQDDVDLLIVVDLEEGDAYMFAVPLENKTGMYKTKVKEKGFKIFPVT